MENSQWSQSDAEREEQRLLEERLNHSLPVQFRRIRVTSCAGSAAPGTGAAPAAEGGPSNPNPQPKKLTKRSWAPPCPSPPPLRPLRDGLSRRSFEDQPAFDSPPADVGALDGQPPSGFLRPGTSIGYRGFEGRAVSRIDYDDHGDREENEFPLCELDAAEQQVRFEEEYDRLLGRNMAEDNPELKAKLEQLDQELEEGDITHKGYQKRRTLILSQYLTPIDVERSQRGLRVHSPENTDHPSSNDGSRAASLAALNNARAPTIGSSSTGDDAVELSKNVGRSTTSGSMDPPSQVTRFQSREAGRNSPVQRQSSYSTHDSTFLPRPNSLQVTNDTSREPTMMSSDYAFMPPSQEYGDGGTQSGNQTRQSTMLESQQGYFSDFAGQQREDQRESYGGGPQRYSQTEMFSPSANIAPPNVDLPSIGAINHQSPLEPRDIPFAVYDPHNQNVPMSKFDNIAAVLRHRGKTNPKQPAYWVLDSKGKEIASITWDKLHSRAEKVAQVIRDKSSLYRGDRVALIYRDCEIIDFAVALLGCFISGVVAVPINNLEDYQRLSLVLTSTQAHLALTTESNLKTFQRDITNQKLQWPRGVEWWKTNEFGSWHPKRKGEEPPVVVPDLAYIEFSRAPTGDLRGVVMSHRTIMHQMACLSAIIATVPVKSRHGEIILSYLDPRQGIGLILGVLLATYGGHTTVWMEARAVETPGLYANLITKYKTTLMVADYPGLKRAAYNYQTDPMTTRNFKKNFEPNFQSVKLCLIDTLTIDCEFHEILADRWLRPLRNTRAREVVAPMLCLPEHGGMIISIRDWLGGEERMGCSLTHEMDKADDHQIARATESKTGGSTSLIKGGAVQPSSHNHRLDLGEVLLEKESLKTNEVVVVAMGEEARNKAESLPNAVRIGAFGYPIPDATLAIVDPETMLLCSPNVIGELWVDSPSLSGGFWALPKHTETIFHARPYRFQDGNPTPVTVEPEFLRTGLLGCVIEGKIFVLGLYEDRLRQRVEWVERGLQLTEHRYFFVQHLIISIMKNVPKIHDCSAFDVFVNDEHLPIVLLESYAASTAPVQSGGPPRQLDTALLDSLSERCMEVLFQEHHVRVFCVMITAPNSLPRVVKNGRREIGNMLCRKEFDNGSLPCVHVKFGVERSVLNLPVGVDILGGIWSQHSSAQRQDILGMQDKQYSGVDMRDVVIDDRSSTPLTQFTNVTELLQWRVARHPEELAYCTIDGRGKEGKGITWKKFDTKVAAVAMYMRNKAKLRPGDHVGLMYTHSEEYVYAVHACFALGVVAIPLAPLDANRLSEDAPAFLHVVQDLKVKALLVNVDVDHLLKQKVVSQHIKTSAQLLRTSIPPTYNTAKPPKQSHGTRDLGLTVKPPWVQPGYPVLVWTYWTPDQRRISVQIGHDTIMGMCKVQKETCQMPGSRPVLGCVRSTSGLGFMHTCILGPYLGAPTYLVSPVDFATNPASLFQALSRYKIKDTYATSQMLDHAMAAMQGKGFLLQELKNMMISMESRPRVDLYQKVRLHFASTGLDRTAINTIYSHVLNPMLTSRSYMCIEPIELWLDTKALRRGLIYPVDPDTDPSALLLQDSGMVPVSTQIAIVNPETGLLCHIGEFGEIWVQSEACAKAFYASKEEFDAEKFNGRLTDGDPNVKYVRTGDLGFLHNVTRPIGPNGQPVDMQVLFVLGAVGETFEINGLSHFPMDIEYSVEKSHRNIVRGGCAVFQAGGLLVVVVEVMRKAYLASIVPVIVNAILNEHQVVVDIIAFVAYGDFPRSRLGEKQRGRILSNWVSRKMRTIAQFGIRDPDAADSQITEIPEERLPLAQNRQSMQSEATRRQSIMPEPEGGSLTLVQSHDRHDAPSYYVEAPANSVEPTFTTALEKPYLSLPHGVSEMPATGSLHDYPLDIDDYEDLLETPRHMPLDPLQTSGFSAQDNVDADLALETGHLSVVNTDSPVASSHEGTQSEIHTPTTTHTNENGHREHAGSATDNSSNYELSSYDQQSPSGDELSPFKSTNPSPPDWDVQQNPFSSSVGPEPGPVPSPLRPIMPASVPSSGSTGKGRATLPSQQRFSMGPSALGGLRIANPTSPGEDTLPIQGTNNAGGPHHASGEEYEDDEDEVDEWPREALMYGTRQSSLGIANPESRPGTGSESGQYGGAGYGYGNGNANGGRVSRQSQHSGGGGSVRGRYDGSGYGY